MTDEIKHPVQSKFFFEVSSDLSANSKGQHVPSIFSNGSPG